MLQCHLEKKASVCLVPVRQQPGAALQDASGLISGLRHQRRLQALDCRGYLSCQRPLCMLQAAKQAAPTQSRDAAMASRDEPAAAASMSVTDTLEIQADNIVPLTPKRERERKLSSLVRQGCPSRNLLLFYVCTVLHKP